MRVTWSRITFLALVLAVGLATAAAAGPFDDRGTGVPVLLAASDNDAPLDVGDWHDNFDSYATGSQMHGQGGWRGWFNDPAAGALTTAAQARTTPNSVDILGPTDLIYEWTGISAGIWELQAYQYIPSGFSGQTYFIALNNYDDACANCNWSVQVNFDSITGLVANDGGSGGTTPIVLDQWVPIRVRIDLDADTQEFYYNNTLLYAGTWSGEVSGGGTTDLAVIDLFANSATSVYYDDVSLLSLPFLDGFESGDTGAWNFVQE